MVAIQTVADLRRYLSSLPDDLPVLTGGQMLQDGAEKTVAQVRRMTFDINAETWVNKEGGAWALIFQPTAL